MDANNIPAIITTFDAVLVYGTVNTPNSNRAVYWERVSDLPLEPKTIFKKLTTILGALPKTESLQVEKACLLTQGHARSLEFIAEYLSTSRHENFCIGKLYSHIEVRYNANSYCCYSDSEILVKLFMLDISNENLCFGKYLDSLNKGEPVEICIFDLKWNKLIREALVLNKMIHENQNLILNLLQLKFFAGKKSDNKVELSCISPLMYVLNSTTGLHQDRSDSFERYHISFEAFKLNVCFEYGKMKVPLRCGKFTFENVDEKLVLPLCQWLHKTNCYDNYKIIIDGPKKSLVKLETSQKQIFSEIDTENYFLCPNNWSGFDSVLNLSILDKSGKFL